MSPGYNRFVNFNNVITVSSKIEKCITDSNMEFDLQTDCCKQVCRACTTAKFKVRRYVPTRVTNY